MAEKIPNPEGPSLTMRLWNQWCNTDPSFTKPFDNGSFKGTDINPTWRAMKLTEQVGPYGIGWGVQKVHYEIMPTHNEGELLILCSAELWYVDPTTGERGVCGPHMGVDYLVKKTAKGDLRTDVEAHKKVLTDAMSSSWRFLGISSDVYMRLFDNSKYRDAAAAAALENGQVFGQVDMGQKAGPPKQGAPADNKDVDELTKIREDYLIAKETAYQKLLKSTTEDEARKTIAELETTTVGQYKEAKPRAKALLAVMQAIVNRTN